MNKPLVERVIRLIEGAGDVSPEVADVLMELRWEIEPVTPEPARRN